MGLVIKAAAVYVAVFIVLLRLGLCKCKTRRNELAPATDS